MSKAASGFFVKGIGFFNDAYDLFVMNLINVILEKEYCRETKGDRIEQDCEDSLYGDNWTAGLSVSVFVGAMCGQIIFGSLADRLGRTAIMIVSCALLFLGGVLCSTAYSPDDKTLLSLLVVFRFILGLGIGAEYPLAAASSAEGATDETRGQQLSLVFSLQGAGNVTAGLAGLIVISSFENSAPYSRDNLEQCWRILFAIGTFPALFGFYFRWKADEGQKFQERNRDLDALDSYSKLSFIFHHYGRRLLGTTGSWFLFDIIFYAQGIFSATVLDELFSDDNLKDVAWENLMIALMALPGYYFAVCYIDSIGRKKLQIIGFMGMGCVYLFMALLFSWLKDITSLFLIVYGLTFFLANFGPNTTTFVIPSESFPTAIRSTCHGISSAAGKLGAIVGLFMFLPIFNSGGDDGYRALFALCGFISLFSMFFTYYFVMDDVGELAKLEEEFEEILKREGTFQKQALLSQSRSQSASKDSRTPLHHMSSKEDGVFEKI